MTHNSVSFKIIFLDSNTKELQKREKKILSIDLNRVAKSTNKHAEVPNIALLLLRPIKTTGGDGAREKLSTHTC